MTDKDSVVKLLEEIKSTLTIMLVYLGVIIIFLFLILISVASAEQQGHWMTLEEKPILYSLEELTIVVEEPIVPGGVVIGSGWLYADRVRYTEQVELKEIITILEKARRHVWRDYSMLNNMVYDPCTSDPICTAQREVDLMRDRKALAERIDQVVKILKEANR